MRECERIKLPVQKKKRKEKESKMMLFSSTLAHFGLECWLVSVFSLIHIHPHVFIVIVLPQWLFLLPACQIACHIFGRKFGECQPLLIRPRFDFCFSCTAVADGAVVHWNTMLPHNILLYFQVFSTFHAFCLLKFSCYSE